MAQNQNKMFIISIEDVEFSMNIKFANYFNFKDAFEFIYNLVKMLRENRANINENILIDFNSEEGDDEEEDEVEDNNI